MTETRPARAISAASAARASKGGPSRPSMPTIAFWKSISRSAELVFWMLLMRASAEGRDRLVFARTNAAKVRENAGIIGIALLVGQNGFGDRTRRQRTQIERDGAIRT